MFFFVVLFRNGIAGDLLEVTHDVVHEPEKNVVVILGYEFVHDGVGRICVPTGSTFFFPGVDSKSLTVMEDDVTVDCRFTHQKSYIVAISTFVDCGDFAVRGARYVVPEGLFRHKPVPAIFAVRGTVGVHTGQFD